MATRLLTNILYVAITILLCAAPTGYGKPITVTPQQVLQCKGPCCLPHPTVGSLILPWRPTRDHVRVRRPLRLAFADPEYLTKYKLAYQKLAESPHAMAGQMATRCAYSDERGFGLNAHHDGLFFPWNRWYLYWHERLLQTLINDTSFSLPFWDWDNEYGRKVEPEFLDASTPLFREGRGQKRKSQDIWLHDALHPETVVHHVVHSNNNPEEFFSTKSATYTPYFQIFMAGKREPEPMDPLFFAHYTNVDRVWWLWKRRPLTDPERQPLLEPNSRDWLDSSFMFYDEKGDLRQASVQDAINTVDLGYTYEDIPAKWFPPLPPPIEPVIKATNSEERQLRNKDNKFGARRLGEAGNWEEGEKRESNHLLRPRGAWMKRWRSFSLLPCESGRAKHKPPSKPSSPHAPKEHHVPPSQETSLGEASVRIPPESAPAPSLAENTRARIAPPKAAINTGPFTLGPGTATVFVQRVLPADRPGFRVYDGTTPGSMNEETLMIQNIDYVVRTPVFVKVYINNPDATYATGTDSGWVGSWVWSPGFGLATSSHPLAITMFLKEENLMDSTTLSVTVVAYVLGQQGQPEALQEVAATVGNVVIKYS